MVDKLNNKGLTLVELIIAMGIGTIIIASITYFMITSTKNYQRANVETTIQLESQTILNQFNELIMEAYNVKMDEEKKTLAIYCPNMTYYIKSQDNQLLLNKKQAGLSEIDNDSWILFGEYVKEFHVVDTGDNNDNRSILISFKVEKNDLSYDVNNSMVTLRNKIKEIPY